MKRLAAMEDISCLGKCSLTVIHPVVSAMGIECAVVPTAVLSTHTAFPAPAVMDLTDHARAVMNHWSTIGARFDGILTGYLADPRQAALALELMDRFAGPDTDVIVDPAMGDHGRLYSGLDRDMVTAMAKLCGRATLALPNITEAAMMTGMEYRAQADKGYCRELAGQMRKLGCGSVMITGAEPEPGKIGFFWSDGSEEFCLGRSRLERSCHGTGDLFAAVVTGGILRGLEPEQAGALAAEFVCRCIADAPEDSRFGVPFETHLGWLAGRM